MKKNRMMRLASILLVLVLMTSSVVGGTFAKYTTSASGSASARVAKWGVDIDIVSGSSFATQYKTHDTDYSGALSVQASTKVVAPGTSSDDVDGNVTFAISGTPEVAVNVDVVFNANKEIKLAAGDYLDGTTANAKNDTFTLTEEYYPVKFTLTKDGTTVVDNGTLKAVEQALTSNSYCAPGTMLDATYTLTWAWAFEQNNQADTYLGNEANAQEFAFDLTITVTQVD